MKRRPVYVFFIVVLLLTACVDGRLPFEFPFNVAPVMKRLGSDLKQNDVYVGDPVFIRILKEEHVLELWMKAERANRYKLVKSYPICRWSGKLGPKYFEGDLQAPEGFYATNLKSLNPHSKYHLSFNINYPNEYDRMYGRTGSYLMVHGDCVSRGCYAMTDRGIEEIYILVEKALENGQSEIPVQVFPFRMTNEKMLQVSNSSNYPFWKNLKQGYDFFEKNGYPPRWRVNYGEYDFY